MRYFKEFAVLVLFLGSSGFISNYLDEALNLIIKSYELKSYQRVVTKDTAKVKLGRMLFFDKVLSGNRDISCATCHHPGLKSGDNLPLAIGVGGNGLGETRTMGEGRDRIPRNSPEIFNRGAREWHTMFWDGRVSKRPGNEFLTPADEKLPEGLENVLAAQAMFPVTSRDEMRGDIGDLDIFGAKNELALISNAAPQSVWGALMRRILEFPEYRSLFKEAYPDIPLEKLGFQHAANAIAAFEIDAFTFTESPWDRYLNGNLTALNDASKRGALLFYGKANCAQCHSGNLFTDQVFHNLGIPQFGPGKDNAAPLDAGRYAETGNPEDKFAFRTPPLRNVGITGPWMHNGAYVNLEDAIRHHFHPQKSLLEYDLEQLEPSLRASYKNDESVINKVLYSLDPRLQTPKDFKDDEIKDLVAFMEALTDSRALNLNSLIPKSVPSGLPIEEINKENRSHLKNVGY